MSQQAYNRRVVYDFSYEYELPWAYYSNSYFNYYQSPQTDENYPNNNQAYRENNNQNGYTNNYYSPPSAVLKQKTLPITLTWKVNAWVKNKQNIIEKIKSKIRRDEDEEKQDYKYLLTNG